MWMLIFNFFLIGKAWKKVNEKEYFKNRQHYQSSSGCSFFNFFWTVTQPGNRPPPPQDHVTNLLQDWSGHQVACKHFLATPLIRVHAARWNSSTDSSEFYIHAVPRNAGKPQNTCVGYNSHQGHQGFIKLDEWEALCMQPICNSSALQFLKIKCHIHGYIEVTNFHLSAGVSKPT